MLPGVQVAESRVARKHACCSDRAPTVPFGPKCGRMAAPRRRIRADGNCTATLREETTVTLPNFLLVGTMKSGTSTLREHLLGHPQIFTPPQEVHFFDRNINYYRGLR